MRAKPEVQWPALVFVVVCAVVLGAQAEVAGGALERVSLSVPAVALVVLGCVSAEAGSPAVAWSGFAALLAIVVVAARLWR